MELACDICQLTIRTKCFRFRCKINDFDMHNEANYAIHFHFHGLDLGYRTHTRSSLNIRNFVFSFLFVHLIRRFAYYIHNMHFRDDDEKEKEQNVKKIQNLHKLSNQIAERRNFSCIAYTSTEDHFH